VEQILVLVLASQLHKKCVVKKRCIPRYLILRLLCPATLILYSQAEYHAHNTTTLILLFGIAFISGFRSRDFQEIFIPKPQQIVQCTMNIGVVTLAEAPAGGEASPLHPKHLINKL
jgi:hypothetical protein